jgi:uncharacterized repeat protein (TIGR01451 family)
MPRSAVGVLCTLLSVLVATAPAEAAPPATCSQVTLVLDESGSVNPYEGTVRDALHAFLNTLTGLGVNASVVEFGTAAKTVFGYTPITSANLSGVFNPYVDAVAVGDIYDSPSQMGPATNWDDALDEASSINAGSGVAPLVLFLTDGDPTAYNLDQSGEPGGVAVTGVTTQAVLRAVSEADEIRAQGSHLVAVGVGNALSDPSSVNRLVQVAGPDIYSGGTLDLDVADVVLVPEFSDLPEALALLAQAMCADPGVTVEKSVNLANVTPGTTVTYQVVVTNTGNVPLHNVVLSDPAVPGCSLTIGDLAVGQSVTTSCTMTVWAPLTNLAIVTGDDPFGTPVRGEDTSEVGLVPTGTGTPGYWKNHPEAWPIAGSEVLIGDWNHDWVCDADETCLGLTIEEALAALSTPPKGDMTWNLGRPLVAAWLNVSAGNDSSCVAATIDLATDWLLAHPLGSGVGGGDSSWQLAAAWAALLDDYNNGRLCAESRDSMEAETSADEVDGPGPASPASQPQPHSEDANGHPGNNPGNGGNNPPPHSSGQGSKSQPKP